MGAVLKWSDVLLEAIKSGAQEKYGGKCEFDNSLEGMSLRPISFIPISKVTPLENSIHGYVVEATVLRQSMGKFRKYLWG